MERITEVATLEAAEARLANAGHDIEALLRHLEEAGLTDADLLIVGGARALRQDLLTLKREIEDALANTTDPVLCEQCRRPVAWERGRGFDTGRWVHGLLAMEQEHAPR